MVHGHVCGHLFPPGSCLADPQGPFHREGSCRASTGADAEPAGPGARTTVRMRLVCRSGVAAVGSSCLTLTHCVLSLLPQPRLLCPCVWALGLRPASPLPASSRLALSPALPSPFRPHLLRCMVQQETSRIVAASAGALKRMEERLQGCPRVRWGVQGQRAQWVAVAGHVGDRGMLAALRLPGTRLRGSSGQNLLGSPVQGSGLWGSHRTPGPGGCLGSLPG